MKPNSRPRKDRFEISVAFAPDAATLKQYRISQFRHRSTKTCERIFALAYTGEGIETTGLVARAEIVLAHMTRPDGKLPHIGDTIDFTVHRPKQPPSDDLVLPDSGWAFFRSGRMPKRCTGSFKSGFISASHRHDDDLARLIVCFR